jgi:Yip1-like protein
MVTTAISPAPGEQEPEAKISAIGRVFGVLFSPKATFEDIVRKPSWIAPLLLIMIFGTGAGVLIGQKVDWNSFIRKQSEQRSSFTNLPQDQQNQQVAIGAKIAPIFADCAGLFIPIGLLISTLILWLGFNLFAGASLKFSTPWAIICHAAVPTILSSILGMIVAFLKAPGTLDPEHFLASNLAAYLPGDAPHWQLVGGTILDIFAIWTLVLTAIGFSVANPKKISKGTAYGIVFGIWIAYFVIRVGLAAM